MAFRVGNNNWRAHQVCVLTFTLHSTNSVKAFCPSCSTLVTNIGSSLILNIRKRITLWWAQGQKYVDDNDHHYEAMEKNKDFALDFFVYFKKTLRSHLLRGPWSQEIDTYACALTHQPLARGRLEHCGSSEAWHSPSNMFKSVLITDSYESALDCRHQKVKGGAAEKNDAFCVPFCD